MPEREADPIWDALTEAFGPVRTSQERGRRNVAVKSLRDADATADEIRIVVEYCRRNFTSYTEMAVCSWFSRALHEHQQAGGKRAQFLRLLGGNDGS